ncbi:hypothetical protein FIBSPDRAFT_942669 [Athelia psychrophila]|uniref:Uncharacterized protein n=1 Tax=Athelia psychrophila TaxID=1759441 RepID=A0A166X9J9_9AGAM|nr:hypothetical protein FIBSPDRAFT_942669 [Fibularhizoctonia sp. CBS 109695]
MYVNNLKKELAELVGQLEGLEGDAELVKKKIEAMEKQIRQAMKDLPAPSLSPDLAPPTICQPAWLHTPPPTCPAPPPTAPTCEHIYHHTSQPSGQRSPDSDPPSSPDPLAGPVDENPFEDLFGYSKPTSSNNFDFGLDLGGAPATSASTQEDIKSKEEQEQEEKVEEEKVEEEKVEEEEDDEDED